MGTWAWTFTDGSNCSEPGGGQRLLNLHLMVDQPGQTCCRTGACISSELICDGNQVRWSLVMFAALRWIV